MTATILDGKGLAASIRAELLGEVHTFVEARGYAPALAVVQVIGDAASERYVRGIARACEQVGMRLEVHRLAHDVSQAALEATLGRLSNDPQVHGILIEMPLPPGLSAEHAVLHMDYRKDVDGIHPHNAGLLAQGRQAMVPNTPAGGMELLHRHGIGVAGKHAVVVGRSPVVGRPMAALLLREHATVTICHTRTPDLAAVVQTGDVVVAAAGRPGLITGAMIKPGAVVVDFGINVQPDGSIVGDVLFNSAVEVAGAITPVPGGTGPVTNVMLLRNVLYAARQER